MRRADGTARAPGGRIAPLRRARTADEVGQALEPGVVVETDLATAEACGAWLDDVDAAEAFEAATDPADFGEGADDGPQ
ncbi:MAG: hypothetical protein OXC19_07520 [Bryobacterales bacterium]|nr:hypothetical protein [Bryobacterales bacterium]